jgi:hypothetical protein
VKSSAQWKFQYFIDVLEDKGSIKSVFFRKQYISYFFGSKEMESSVSLLTNDMIIEHHDKCAKCE